MSEKYPNYQRNSGDEQPHVARGDLDPVRATRPEADSDAEWQLRGAVGEALLRTVYDIVEHPSDTDHDTALALAVGLVQLTHRFDLDSDTDCRTLGALANYVGDQIIEFAHAYDDLTTSDLQGVAEALALRLVRNQLSVNDTTRPSDPSED
jgi:hypothetical protein